MLKQRRAKNSTWHFQHFSNFTCQAPAPLLAAVGETPSASSTEPTEPVRKSTIGLDISAKKNNFKVCLGFCAWFLMMQQCPCEWNVNSRDLSKSLIVMVTWWPEQGLSLLGIGIRLAGVCMKCQVVMCRGATFAKQETSAYQTQCGDI